MMITDQCGTHNAHTKHFQALVRLVLGGACIGADYSVRSCLITVGITEGRWEVREDCDEEKENGHNEEGGGG